VNTTEPAGGGTVSQWLVEAHLTPGVQANVERLARSEDVRHVVVLPDVHLGKLINNGCVGATVDLVYPQAVGGDIGCGFSAIGFNGTAEFLADDRNARKVIRRFYQLVPALKLPQSQGLPAKLSDWALSEESLVKASRRDGALQLGTLGCGNHFVEFQRDDAGALWLMVHSGSRAMGQVITEFHLSRAAVSSTGLKFLDARTAAGQAYLNDMAWAVEYATLNRLAIIARTVEIIGAQFGVAANEESYMNSPHNFARREWHVGQQLFVHRKSANSARRDELSLIAGSMGSPSYLVHGLGEERALCSSSHGAGRVMSRTEARQRFSPTDLKRQLGAVKHDERVLPDLCDEAPSAYRDIREVMRAQRDLVRQNARLRPMLNFKYPDRRKD
jgi:tRNA-splicing ligase RtcB